MKKTFVKKINKSSKRIVKKASKVAKKNPVAAVGIGSAITGIAATAMATTACKSAKHGFAAIAAKRAAKAANNNENITTPPATTDTPDAEDDDVSSDDSSNEDPSPPDFNTVDMKAHIQAVILGSFKLNNRPLTDTEISRFTVELTKQFNCIENDAMSLIYKTQDNLVREINKIEGENTEADQPETNGENLKTDETAVEHDGMGQQKNPPKKKRRKKTRSRKQKKRAKKKQQQKTH